MQAPESNSTVPAVRFRDSILTPAVLDRATCASAAIVAFVVYVASLPPGVTGEDSGELVAAAYALGIPHPPGYPLWTLLGYAATHLIPFGSVAWRAGVLSAFFGALTVGVIAEIVLLLFRRRDIAWVTAVLLTLSREFWEQSVIAEVYTLGAFLVALSLWLAILWSRNRRRSLFYAATAVAGLATAHYSLNVVLLPLLFLFAFACDLSPRRFRFYAVAAACSLPGWLIYLYLPIRALSHPPMNWGDPQTWGRFWDVVSRGQYAHLLAATPRTWDNFGRQCLGFGRAAADQFTPAIGLLAIPGILLLIVRDRAIGFLLAAAFVLFAVGGVVIPNFPIEYHWIWVNTPYWIPVYTIAAIFLGATFDWLLRVRVWPRNVPAVVSAIMLVCVGFWSGMHSFRRGDVLVANYASDLMDTFAPDAVYFGGGDHTVFPLIYLQVVEGRRPDVLIANRYGYPDMELYALVGETPPPFRPPDSEEDRLFARALELDRPVYSATPRPAATRAKVYEGLLYRYIRASETYVSEVAWPKYHPPAREPDTTRGDWSNELVSHEYWAALGRRLLQSGDAASGAEFLDYAAAFVHGDKAALNNIGLALAEHGRIDDASGYFARALDADPGFVPALLNLARCRIVTGVSADAVVLLDRALNAGADPATVEQMKRAASHPSRE